MDEADGGCEAKRDAKVEKKEGKEDLRIGGWRSELKDVAEEEAMV